MINTAINRKKLLLTVTVNKYHLPYIKLFIVLILINDKYIRKVGDRNNYY